MQDIDELTSCIQNRILVLVGSYRQATSIWSLTAIVITTAEELVNLARKRNLHFKQTLGLLLVGKETITVSLYTGESLGTTALIVATFVGARPKVKLEASVAWTAMRRWDRNV
jgi:hypothetical protein